MLKVTREGNDNPQGYLRFIFGLGEDYRLVPTQNSEISTKCQKEKQLNEEKKRGGGFTSFLQLTYSIIYKLDTEMYQACSRLRLVV